LTLYPAQHIQKHTYLKAYTIQCISESLKDT